MAGICLPLKLPSFVMAIRYFTPQYLVQTELQDVMVLQANIGVVLQGLLVLIG